MQLRSYWPASASLSLSLAAILTLSLAAIPCSYSVENRLSYWLLLKPMEICAVLGSLSCAKAALAKSRMQRVASVAILVKVLIFISVCSLCDSKIEKRRERNDP